MRLPIALWCVVAATAVALAQGQTPLTLRQAEQIGLKNNPRIGAARFTAQAAGQVPAELRSSFLPQFAGNITGAGASDGSRIAAGSLNNPVIYDRLATGFSLSQMITDFGRTGNLVAGARLRAQAEEQNTETARAEIVLQVDQAYYGLLRAQNVLTVARQTVQARQLVVDQVTALAQSKLKSQLDVSFASVNLSEAKLLLASAENQVRANQADLAAAMGYSNDQTLRVSEEPMPGALVDQPDTLIAEAIRSRPELANLRLREGADLRLAKAERALYFPTISTVAMAGYVPGRQDLLRSRYAAMGVNINIPVLNGGLFKARRSEAELRAQAAEQRLKDMENQVSRDVRVAYLNALTAYQRVGLTAQMMDQARLALTLAQSRYDIGLGSIIELSQAQLNATSAEIASITAKYDYQAERAALDYQVGVNR